jgi:uncharacterized protein involved in exopolysaccharide biosynthesis
MNSGVQSDTQGDQAPAGGFAFGDILFTLFRHKFLILAGVLFGIGAALVVRYVKPPNYESTAQIYVPYIVEPTLFQSCGSLIPQCARLVRAGTFNSTLKLIR